ncbi:MAG TPA: hypothetical protein VFS08_04685 [Gemmatimonadaceae bacterium]|nr:hypothetical protein [Gemmatimonadaceae bacterium]
MSPRLVHLVVATLAVAAAPAAPAAAQEQSHELHAELLVGTAWSLPTPLVVRLPGEAPLRIRAHYATRPLADAPYYAYRLGGGPLSARGAATGVEGELVHHKLYLEDARPPVEHFEVTHGYNLLTANAVRPAGRLSVRVGIGIVVAHAEGRIASQRVGGTRRTFLGGGYHLAGITAQLAVGRAYALGRGRTTLYAVPEAKLTASLARVPLGDAGGTILVPNVALHALAGLGVRRVIR